MMETSRYRLRIDQNDFGSGRPYVLFWHEGPNAGDRVTVCEPESGQEWEADIIEVPTHDGRTMLAAVVDHDTWHSIEPDPE